MAPWSTWTATEWAAAAAVANVVLLVVLVAATLYYAGQTRATVDELRRARVLETLPVLHWQRDVGGGAGYVAGGGGLEIRLRLLLTNYGRGPARLLALSAVTDHGEVLTPTTVILPSTLPAGERIAVDFSQNRGGQDYPGERVVTITLRYADAHELRVYETRPRVTANWPAQGNSSILTFDADERSPEQRRVKA